MPSLYRAHVGLDRATWDWHQRNPGQLSRIAQERVRQEIALDSLPDGLRDDALQDATRQFFRSWALQGEYAVIGCELARHKATDEQMLQDANWLHVPPDRLLATLQDLFDLELEMQLRERAILVRERAILAAAQRG